MTGKLRVCKLVTCVLPAVVVAGFVTGAAVACDTPVYRYAMYNWNAAPYQFIFFHNPEDKETSEKEAGSVEVNRLLLDLSTSDEPANVNLVEVDVTDRESIERLPEAIKAAWKRCREKNGTKESGGIHVVFSPWGRELFAGRLDVDAVRAMTESPARKRLGELLGQGKLVAVCLNGKQEADNRRAEEMIQALAEEALQAQADTKADDEKSPKVELALLNVSPSDPEETWFVKNLMLAEPDLNEYAGQTMIFMAYGRGRSMLPYVGRGITTDNLESCVSFLTGACSCEAKADNPGVDILMRWNWEAAADAMAAADDSAPARDGQLAYHEFDPSELSDEQRRKSRKPGPENDMKQPDEKLASGTKSFEIAETTAPGAGSSAVEAVEPASSGSFASRQTWILGGGLAVVAVVVLISGLFVMRRN